MARNTYRTSYENRYDNGNYVYGSAARDAYVRRQMEEPVVPGQHHIQHEEQVAAPFSIGATLAIIASLVILGFAIVNYVQLRGELSSTITSVSRKEITLANIKSKNEEIYSRVSSSIDLQEIERIAKTELGMSYAEEGQVILYNSAGNDYMRKAEGQD